MFKRKAPPSAPPLEHGLRPVQNEEFEADAEQCVDSLTAQAVDDESDEGDARTAVNSETGQFLSIVFPNGTGPVCFLCRKSSQGKSFLKRSCPQDKHGGLVPWPSYRKVYNDDGHILGRTPRGNICLPSRTVYVAIGFDVT